MRLSVGSLRMRFALSRALVERGARVAAAGPRVYELACERASSSGTLRAGTGVRRIRRLQLRLELPPEALSVDGLAEAFARALGAELERLSRGAPSQRVEIVRTAGLPEWRARFVGDVLRGTAAGRWEYAEYEPLPRGSPAAAIEAALAMEPGALLSNFAAVESAGDLERALRVLGEAALERLFAPFERTLGAHAGRPSLERLLAVVAVLLEDPPGSFAGLRSRVTALRVHLVLARTTGEIPSWPEVRDACAALATFLDARRDGSSDPAARARLARSLAPRAVDALARLLEHPGERPSSSALARLAQEADRLDEKLRGPEARQAHWFPSSAAGLFLLVEGLRRDGARERVLATALGSRHRERLWTWILAGSALALLRLVRAVPPIQQTIALDPGLACFAGWMEEPDLAGLRRLAVEGSPAERRELLDALLGERTPPGAESDWSTTLETLGHTWTKALLRRVRGFERSSVAFAVARFLAIEGRVRIEDELVRVRLASSPFLVALRVSGMEQALGPVAWFGGRRLVLELEGL